MILLGPGISAEAAEARGEGGSRTERDCASTSMCLDQPLRSCLPLGFC